MPRFCRKLVVFFVSVFLSVCLATPGLALTFDVQRIDPPDAASLASNEPLYFSIRYQSDVPIRFQGRAYFAGQVREFGILQGHADLYGAGEGTALAWIAFDNPTRIDELLVVAYDEAWNRLDQVVRPVDVGWNRMVAETPRQPADWVTALQKKSRLNLDYQFDPSPNRPEASDAIFILSVLSVPLYLFLQIRMLRRYRQRWRELATVPLITALPMVLYAFWVGIGFNPRLWPPFFLYFMLASCFYLVVLWVIKKIRKQPSAGDA